VTSLVEGRLDALKQIKLTTVTVTKMIVTITMTAMTVGTTRIKMVMTKMAEIKVKGTQTTVETRMTVTRTTATTRTATTTIPNRLKYLTLKKHLRRSVTLLTIASKRSREHFSKWTGLSTTFKSS